MKAMLLALQSAPRRLKQCILFMGDVVMIPLLVLLAWSLRVEQRVLLTADVMAVLLLATLLGGCLLLLFGIYRTVVRAFDEHFVSSLMLAVMSYSVLMFGAAFTGWLPMPRSVALVSGFFLFIWVWGSRSAIRVLMAHLARPSHASRRGLVIYGAGQAGRQFLAAAMRALDQRPVAFLDDSQQLIGTTVCGLPVFSGERAASVVARYDVEDIIIALPSASRARRRQIIERLEQLPVHVRSLPPLDRLLRGEIRVTDVEEVDIADLLGRDPVPPRPELMVRDITGRAVLVTGAGGSIGSELCRQILQLHPERLVLVEHNEFALYQLDQELRARWPGCELISVLGSIMDGERMERLFRRHDIQTVYHAAAYKHVPLVEANPFEGVRNNALGTYLTACAALAAGVSRFVLVSTDKAVRPTNVMGASKRLAELALQALARESTGRTCFAMVRFGNVLGSSGSVVPLFRQQLARGGPITVTHPEVTRYFMTIPEASQLVIQAGAMSTGGDVFVLDMGQSVRIVDLARKMIRLSGLTERTVDTPDGDIEIVYTGLRPGEKLYEELLIGDSNIQITTHHRIRKAHELHKSLDEMRGIFTEIDELARVRDTLGLKRLLLWHVEGYVPDMRGESMLSGEDTSDCAWSAASASHDSAVPAR